MQDRYVDAPQPRQERAPWIEPALSRLQAGAAELEVAQINDGPNDLS